jgi:hypothetical protein
LKRKPPAAPTSRDSAIRRNLMKAGASGIGRRSMPDRWRAVKPEAPETGNGCHAAASPSKWRKKNGRRCGWRPKSTRQAREEIASLSFLSFDPGPRFNSNSMSEFNERRSLADAEMSLTRTWRSFVTCGADVNPCPATVRRAVSSPASCLRGADGETPPLRRVRTEVCSFLFAVV